MVKKSQNGFTLVEIMIGILIFSTVIVSSFYALTSLNIGRVRLAEEIDLEKEAFFFTEKLFKMIKEGGTIDYEEYFNRAVYNQGKTPLYYAGHYNYKTGFGVGTTFAPSASSYFYCQSKNTQKYNYNLGCVSDFNISSVSGHLNRNYTGERLHYGQYALQFIDYNSDLDSTGDENLDGDWRRDNDDLFTGQGPGVVGPDTATLGTSTGGLVQELYLISGDNLKRTFFRYTVKQDPNAPTGTCTLTNMSTTSALTSSCLGNIEFIKLAGKDWGLDHNVSSIDSDGSQYDGKIDTWTFDKDFYKITNDYVPFENIAQPTTISDGSVAGSYNYWTPIFSEDIHVKKLQMYLYPGKDPKLAWKDGSATTNIAPYLRMNITVMPSWKKRKGMKGRLPEFNYTLTISLTDLLFR